ncbi:MBL fold metallo-hydrolase [Chryseolinea lacunae]|uniref:MBL fold metallo-hydrolase n=1 Tax=Chryseolinea lacunae TaxID=2801331 RepID=A0ABS1KY34_9BACT|nr:MBL fold metallo-hydrolase [Chryseolinea lacunae]MBL0744356.1 MBL fold metallo-hydrolase [Chryseolinea lacunae]
MSRLKRIVIRIIKGLALTVVALSLITYLFMQQKPFGKLPSGARLERIKKSPHYRDGAFQNLEETPMLAKDVSYMDMVTEYFSKGEDKEPTKTLPSVRTDLKHLPDGEPSIVWFGHSSYLIHIDGKNILVDPVFSLRASPVQYMGMKAYPIETPYSLDDFPDLDAVIITHDHYDHLDYNSILKLKDKTKNFYTALGVGSHLAHWGIEEERIHEFDWWEGETISPGMQLTATPARHFSGRGFTRYQTLWASFVLSTPTNRIFIGGDSGYDGSFKNIGDKFGPFDIALLECGQYDRKWPFIHMMPEQTVQAAIDLKTRVLMPVHWGKFTLSVHPWRDPIRRAKKEAAVLHMPLTTPRIGEVLKLNSYLPNKAWWE